MINLQMVYAVAGLLFMAFAAASARDRANRRRWGTAAFWALVGTSFLFGDLLADWANGLIVVALGLIAGLGLLGHGRPATTSPEERRAGAGRFGNTLFLPALAIPAVTVFGALVLKTATVAGRPLLEPGQATLVSLALGALAALALAMALLKPPWRAPLDEGRRLVDTVGWAGLLPQALAALGAVFALSGLGKAVGTLIGEAVPLDHRFAAVAAYTVGMAGFTALMGNAFAAFPVMTAAVGLPILVGRFGADPAVIGAIGMLSGFCGTLTTPMAANFNIVPVALLELDDRWAVIRVQLPTAAILLAANTALMYVLAFRS